MSENELKDTQPNPVSGETQPSSPQDNSQPKPVGRRFPRWLAALIFVLLIAIGILGGYDRGMTIRYNTQGTQVAGHVQEQMTLGQQALAAGQYEIAKQHFDYVVQHDPNFPGLQEALTQLLLKMNTTPTLTLTPSPTITPTTDLRGAETIYNQALAQLNAQDWDGAVTSLDSLRKVDATYRTADVDGMYYTALRMRGVGKIAAPKCADANLEGGIYDLTLAERFGPLDSVADSLRTYARLYIIGASFWDQDWVQAQYYFSQVMSAYPNMADISCDSSTKRWQYATIQYAQQLLAAGDYCGAEKQYAAALTVGSSLSQTIIPTATAVNSRCNGGGPVKTKKATPTKGPGPAETPTQTAPPPENPTETSPSG